MENGFTFSRKALRSVSRLNDLAAAGREGKVLICNDHELEVTQERIA